MIMHVCPHCQKPGISFARRMCLGPVNPATCRVCGGKVGVPYSSMWTVFPFVAAIGAATFVGSFPLKAALWAAGFVAMSICHLKLVPLIRR